MAIHNETFIHFFVNILWWSHISLFIYIFFNKEHREKSRTRISAQQMSGTNILVYNKSILYTIWQNIVEAYLSWWCWTGLSSRRAYSATGWPSDTSRQTYSLTWPSQQASQDPSCCGYKETETYYVTVRLLSCPHTESQVEKIVVLTWASS